MGDRRVAVVDVHFAAKLKQWLKTNGVFDDMRKPLCIDGMIAMPVTKYEVLEQLLKNASMGKNSKSEGYYCIGTLQFRLSDADLSPSQKSLRQIPCEKLLSVLKSIGSQQLHLTDNLVNEVPKHWEKHGDLILFPDSSFRSQTWEVLGDQLWSLICHALGGKRLARKGVIKNDAFRSPQVELLFGENGWVEHTDDGIRYAYDLTKCMFSSGNITEKLRVASFDCRGETVVDMFSGIGYFTLPYLIHAGATQVYACEWNPHAVEALRRNLHVNHIEHRAVVCEGNNIEVCPVGIADRVNLGLIPSSEDAWYTACRALKPKFGGILHIHGNVTSYNRKSKEKDSEKTNCLDDSDCKDDGHCCDSIRNVKGSHGDNPINEQDLQMKKIGLKSLVSHCSKENLKYVDAPEALNTRSRSKTNKFQKQTVLKSDWIAWSDHVTTTIQTLLHQCHGGSWTCTALHIEHVKSYAPHVDHLVCDLECRPIFN